jgi:anti-sigma factor RsiW
MKAPRTWLARGTRSIEHGHASDAQLSDVLDDCIASEERALIDAHVGGCPSCAERRRGLAAVMALGALERVTARAAPDQWPIIAACTVHERRLQRFFARRVRRRMYVWILLATLSGVLLTEELLRAAHATARSGAWIAAQARLHSASPFRRPPSQPTPLPGAK